MVEVWDYKIGIIDYLNKIDSITSSEEKQKFAEEFAGKLIGNFTNNEEFIIERIREINSDVEALNIPKSLMDSLKEAIFCYVNGQYLSTIASIGITSELFCVHIYRIFLTDIGLEDIHVRRRTNKFNLISQSEKIDTMFSIINISEDICSMLHEIRTKRNENIHPNQTKDYHEDALHCLQGMIYILNKYSEGIRNKTEDISSQNKIPVQKDNDLIIGEKWTKLSMFWYLDYQCVFCKQFWEETLPLLKKEYIDTNKMKIILRDFPLSSIHPLAKLSAETIRCLNQNIRDEEISLKIHDKIFENQNSLSEENLKLWVKDLGCSVDSCISSGQVSKEINDSIVDAQLSGARGTPYFIIGSIPVSGSQPYGVFKQVIDSELQKKA